MHIQFPQWHREVAEVLGAVPARARHHRLAVAFPLFFLMVVFSVAHVRQARVEGSVTDLYGTIGPVVSDQRWVSAKGERVLLSEGAVVEQRGDALHLRNGEALFQHDGLMRIAAGPYILSGWSGGFAVIVAGDQVTVVPLTTPVVVQGGAGRFVVRTYMQWTGAAKLPVYDGDLSAWEGPRALHAVPEDYLKRQIERLHDLEQMSVLPSTGAPGNASFLNLDALRLPAARARARQERTERLRGELSRALQTGDESTAASILRAARAAGVLAAFSQDDLPVLLSLAAGQHLASWFLPAFTATEEGWLLASLHPALRDAAWFLPAPAVTDEARLTRLLMFVRSDVQAGGSAPTTIERWGREVQDFVQAQREPLRIFQDLLPALARDIDRFIDLSYPLRARQYASAVLSVAADFQADLSVSAATTLAHLRDIERQPLPPEAPAMASSASSRSASSEASQAPKSILGAAEAERLTAETLSAHAALFTTQTRIQSREDGTVAVTNIGFATPQGDQLFTFTYDPQTQTVHAIQQDGNTLPYTVDFDAFVRWVKGE